VTEAARFPVAVGVKVTLIVQCAPAARLKLLAGHVLVSAKSPLLAPLRAILEIVNGPVPLFVSVTVWAALAVVINWPAKVRVSGESVTTGTTPVPVRDTLCGLPVALSVMLTLAVRLPVAVGLKVTLIVQFAPAARVALLAGQVFVSAKSPLSVPVTAILAIVSEAVPVLFSVIV